MTYPGMENDPQVLASNPDLAAAFQRLKDIAAEYGEFVATQPIKVGSDLMAVPGDELPASTVKRLKWDELGYAAKRTTAQGREVLERTGKATTEEMERWKADDKAAADRERERVKAEKDAADKAAEKATAGKPAKTGSKSTEEGAG